MYIDELKRQLKVPPRFAPYMEKHRIYELFHELTIELLIQRPADHTAFLKLLLCNAAKARGASRIIILAPPFVDKTVLAQKLARITGARTITIPDILESASNVKIKKKSPEDILRKPKLIAEQIKKITRNETVYCFGWILLDFPNTLKDAFVLASYGILPTHVFQLIPAFSAPTNPLAKNDVPSSWLDYRRNLIGLRHCFSRVLKEIRMDDRELDQVVSIIVEILKAKKLYKGGPPSLPRLCLLGPRGSGRKTLAKMLCEQFGIIHIDLNELKNKLLAGKSAIGEELKLPSIGSQRIAQLHAQIINSKLMEQESIDCGWVMTGYPITTCDFRRLDLMQTPPNKVAFLYSCDDACRKHVYGKRYNVYTGSITNIIDRPEDRLYKRLGEHPKDNFEFVEAELAEYKTHLESLLKYCGGTASKVNACDDIKTVYDRVEAVVMAPVPECEPRMPVPVKKVHRSKMLDPKRWETVPIVESTETTEQTIPIKISESTSSNEDQDLDEFIIKMYNFDT